MNGIHDMGGMHGFGAVPVDDETPFHDDLDRTMFAMHMLAIQQGIYNLDELRHARERMPPAEHLTAGYWERDLVGLEMLLVENGYFTQQELDDWLRDFDGEVPRVADPELKQVARDKFAGDRITPIQQQDPAFTVGDHVKVKNIHPSGHTRIPRYARGKQGVVRKQYGTFHLPDAIAHGREEAEPCYSVVFEPEELWGPDSDADSIGLDMWESYLHEVLPE